MSPYGATKSAAERHVQLPCSSYDLRDNNDALVVFHLTTVPSALADYLYLQFQEELDRGATYPQQLPMSRTAFDEYFLANDLFVGVIAPTSAITLEQARGGREWTACLGGAYYVGHDRCFEMSSDDSPR